VKRFFLYGGVILAAIVVAILLYATAKPDTFRIERAIAIQAPPERVFALVDDFRSWGSWSPWEKIDPAMKRSFSGADSGQGAVYAWEGNSDVGSGRMEITESVPSSKVVIDLHFLMPFESRNTTVFTIEPSANGTTVTWVMSGPSPYISKVMTTFFSMDKMLGGQFESGLANLKAVAER
jgi:uncharacterized protein YndB with AHSA1/START domain